MFGVRQAVFPERKNYKWNIFENYMLCTVKDIWFQNVKVKQKNSLLKLVY